ncbi:MAG TPA: NAD(P)/FAD-dependent oxidoreductase [Candidatus Acidoferrales bacterium]|nr:NAD(P)/FAD-dependent oxidoreductase [Candidatus Acidoferrales bacterium]
MNTDYDVIVAGAGVAGMISATSAAKHSKQSLKILVIDRNSRAEAGKKTAAGWVCGDAVSKGSIEYLQHEVGVSYGSPELEHPVRGVVAYSPDHKSKAMFDGEGYVVNRKLLPQRQLNDAEKLGVEFQFETYADSLIVEDGFIRGLHCRSSKDNSTFKRTAKLVVDATGSASRLRTSLPIPSYIEKEIDKENDLESTGRYILKFEASGTDSTYFDPNTAIIHLDQEIAPGGYAWVFPKGQDKMNVGLGVSKRLLEQRNKQLGKNDTLQSLIDQYVKTNPVIKSWKLADGVEDEGNARGNWQVPVRRQNDCMVANGYMIVGDAAWMPRPIDAGGIGPAIYASTIAGKVVAEALEQNDTSENGIWKFNSEYVKVYGYRMASFEVLRRFLQILSNDDLNYGMKHFLSQDDVDNIIQREHPEFKRVGLGNPSQFLWALPRLALARGLKYTAEKSQKLIAHYMNYPTTPAGFPTWHDKFMAELREAYARFS